MLYKNGMHTCLYLNEKRSMSNIVTIPEEYQFYAGDVPFSVKYAAGSGTGFIVKNQAEIDQNLAAIAQRAPSPPTIIQPT